MNYNFFFSLSILSTTFSIGLGIWSLFRFPRLNPEQTLLARLIIFSALVELIAFPLMYFGQNNLPLLHLFTVIEFFFLAKIYQLVLKEEIPNPIFKYGIGLFVLMAITYAFFINSIWKHNDLIRAVQGTVMIVLSMLFFYYTLKKSELKYLERQPMFWINTGNLIYFSTALSIFLFSNYGDMTKSKDDLPILIWSIHVVIAIIRNICYAIAIGINFKDD